MAAIGVPPAVRGRPRAMPAWRTSLRLNLIGVTPAFLLDFGPISTSSVLAVLVWSPAAGAQATAAGDLRGVEMLAALRAGGFIIYFRHTDTDFRQNDARMAASRTAPTMPANDLGL